MEKIIFFVFMLCVFCMGIQAQEMQKEKTIVLVSGSTLAIFPKGNADLPESGVSPLEFVLDESEEFTSTNLAENANIGPHLNAKDGRILLWEGYLNIPEEGKYVFSCKCLKGSYNKNSDVTVYVNDKLMFAISTEIKEIKRHFKRNLDKKTYDSKTLFMKQGDYKFQIFMTITGPNNYVNFKNIFSLQYWNKSEPLQKYAVTPAKLFHIE